MRRLVLGLSLLGLICAFSGCQSACNNSRGGRLHGHGHHGHLGHHGGHGGHHYRPPEEPAGGPVGQYAYPYYTLRGPRDFLVDNPPSIGPY